MFIVQALLGIIAIILVIIGWIRDYQPEFIVSANYLVAVIIFLSGLEKYRLDKNKGFFLFTICVSIVLVWYWSWRYSLVISFG